MVYVLNGGVFPRLRVVLSLEIKIYDGKDLRDGKGWEFVKDLSFQNANAKIAFAPVRVWQKDGKAGAALEATELVIQEGEIRTKMADCFSLDKL